MLSGLTNAGKATAAIIIAAALAALFIFVIKPNIKDSGSKSTSTEKKSSGGGISDIFSSGVKLTITYNTFIGCAGMLEMNDGIVPNKDSRLYKEYGILLTINIQDVVSNSRSSLTSGEIDGVYCTTDALSIDMGAGSTVSMVKAKQVFSVNISRGADALVVDPSIKKISDLKGKDVAVAMGTASQTALIKFLELNKMTLKDINIIECRDGIEASRMFKAGSVPAAMVWYPDNVDCIKAIAGAKELINTKMASNIVSDGMLFSEETINKKREAIEKLVTAWMIGNAEVTYSETAKQHVAKVFARDFLGNESDAGLAYDMLGAVRFCTYGDNVNFFGLNPSYTGVTGDEMYTKMSVIYSNLGQTKSPLPWRSVSDISIIQAIDLSSDSKQIAEVAPKFEPITKEMSTAPAISNIKASINFATNSYELDEDAKYIIKKEFFGIAKSLRDARIRIKGNTDNVGNAAYNKTLSQKRAQAVANFLVKEGNFDPNKFIIIGNGSMEAIADGSVGSNENYRRTDFEVIN